MCDVSFAQRPLNSSISISSNEANVVSSTSLANDVYSAFGELIGQTLRRLDNNRRAEAIQRKLLMVMYEEIDRTDDLAQMQFHDFSH